MAISDIRFAELERRIDAIVSSTAKEMIWGKALYRQFDKHCEDDEQRHVENVATMAEIENALLKQSDALQRLNHSLAAAMPTMRRLHRREAARRLLWQIVRRWRVRLVAFAVGAGGLFVWLDGHWPKIAAILRKFGLGAP